MVAAVGAGVARLLLVAAGEAARRAERGDERGGIFLFSKPDAISLDVDAQNMKRLIKEVNKK
jgi:hypothetical protein